MTVDVAIVHCPVGGGHKAAAHAVAEACAARGRRVVVLDMFEHAPSVVGDTYLAAHLAWTARAPDSYGRAYHGANWRGGAWEPIRLKFDQLVFRRLAERVRALRPRAVIATHHLPLVVLGRERRKARLEAPVVGVVTDYGAHAVWAERGVDAFAVPSTLARADLERHGADPNHVHLTGIPVREAFEQTVDVVSPQPDESVRVLVTCGGFGVGPLARILASFAGVPRASLTVVCGASEAARVEAAQVATQLRLNAKIVGFEPDMPARIARAHVVVGKAGGLTVTESLAAGRALVLVGSVPGNEKLNEAFVVNSWTGVASEPDDVARTILTLRARGDLEAMGRRGRLVVPAGAAERVIAVTESLVRRRSRAA